VGRIHTASRCKVFGSKCTTIRAYPANVHCRCLEEHRNVAGMVLKLCGQVVARCFYNIQIMLTLTKRQNIKIILTLTKRQYKSGIRISRISERSLFFCEPRSKNSHHSKKVETSRKGVHVQLYMYPASTACIIYLNLGHTTHLLRILRRIQIRSQNKQGVNT
jgi:hypothetical protein